MGVTLFAGVTSPRPGGTPPAFQTCKPAGLQAGLAALHPALRPSLRIGAACAAPRAVRMSAVTRRESSQFPPPPGGRSPRSVRLRRPGARPLAHSGRVLPALLALLLVLLPQSPTGIDLCTCTAEEHGMLCEGRAAVPSVRTPCCGRGDTDPRVATGEERCPSCPSFELPDGPELSPTGSTPFDPLVACARGAGPVSPRTVMAQIRQVPARGPRPPPSGRLHLLYGVLLL